ncbi:uncharacterized protein LOC118424492 [Branchiostoma floridae]|uniref:Uncharacterized protein LOC118424492 n=1 Tax=Branchiostoma floridae TaxID=7739 RepID=C3ZHE7_BRAFL|nr:uncharacterized protein LOC118424492 [Branchiostoma floridae]|eukprot:XP_002591931.1 hypothetical protein BRAFLDRAFT_79530 [Branchiostoma floridae]
MPKKRDDEATKQAIADKVKQIQSKQARWMQERKEQLDRGGGRQHTQTGGTAGQRGAANRRDKKPAAQSTNSAYIPWISKNDIDKQFQQKSTRSQPPKPSSAPTGKSRKPETLTKTTTVHNHNERKVLTQRPKSASRTLERPKTYTKGSFDQLNGNALADDVRPTSNGSNQNARQIESEDGTQDEEDMVPSTQSDSEDSTHSSNQEFPKQDNISSAREPLHKHNLKPNKAGNDVENGVKATEVQADQSGSRSARARAMLSPDMFDALADQIANRLKVRMDKPASREDTGGGGQVSQETSIDTHKCQVCSSLMVPPDHRPMLVIPCGHTFCSACVRHTDTCPGCGQEVSSLTCNIMLQQIIMEYKSKRKPKTRDHSNLHISSANHTYAPQKYSGGTSRFDSLGEERKTVPSSVKRRDPGSHGDGKHKGFHGNRGEDYVEKYHTLTVRCEVLETEADGIRDKMEAVAKQLEREQKQVAAIEKQEESLREQIRMIEEKISSLQSHKEGYRDTCDELEGQHFNLASKLSMVEVTLQSLTVERDKVRILAHNFDPSINIEDD